MLLSAGARSSGRRAGPPSTKADDGVGAGGEERERAEARIGGGDERSGLRAGAPAEVAEPFRIDRRARREHIGRRGGPQRRRERWSRVDPARSSRDVGRCRERVGGRRRGDRHRDGPPLGELDRLREKLGAIAARPVDEHDAGHPSCGDRLDQVGLDRVRLPLRNCDVVDDDRALPLDHAVVDEAEAARGVVGEGEPGALAGAGSRRWWSRAVVAVVLVVFALLPAAGKGEERERAGRIEARARPGSAFAATSQLNRERWQSGAARGDDAAS